MKWLKVIEYTSKTDVFIRYNDIDCITNNESDRVTTIYMKNGKKILLIKLIQML